MYDPICTPNTVSIAYRSNHVGNVQAGNSKCHRKLYHTVLEIMNCPNCNRQFLWGEVLIRAALNGNDKFCCPRCRAKIKVVEVESVSFLQSVIRCWLIPLFAIGLPFEFWSTSPALLWPSVIILLAWTLHEFENVYYNLKLDELDDETTKS